MTQEEQRLAIAEFCGAKRVSYKKHKPGGNGGPFIFVGDDGKVVGFSCSIPNYPVDLNAMRQAVLALPPRKRVDFTMALYWVATTEAERHPDHFISDVIAEKMVTASAGQWALAFLRTIDRWKE